MVHEYICAHLGKHVHMGAVFSGAGTPPAGSGSEGNGSGLLIPASSLSLHC